MREPLSDTARAAHDSGVIAVQPLGPADEARVFEAAALFDPAPDPAAVRAMLASPSDHLLLATLDGKPAGVARAHELRRPDAIDPRLLVTEIRVAPALRRRGVGHAIILALKQLARSRGARSMTVLTDLAEPAPEGLYASTGGVQAARRNMVYVYDLADATPLQP